MDHLAAIRGASERREPQGLNMVDLSMLVVGFALAFSLPQLHHLDDGSMWIGATKIPMPGGSAEFLVLQEWAMKGGLVVVPVILARRSRDGGLPRPADWLAIFVALPWAREALVRFRGVQKFARWWLVDFRSWLGYSVEVQPYETIRVGDQSFAGPEGLPVGFTPMDEFRFGCGCAAIVFVGLGSALWIGRRRIPAWVKPALIFAAAFAGLEVWGYASTAYLLEGWYAVSRRVGLPMDMAFQVASGLYSLPEGLLFGSLVVAALLDLRRGHKRRAWTGWVGLAATLIALAAGVGIDASHLPFEANPVAFRQFAILFLRWFAAGLAGWIIVECARRAGRPSDESLTPTLEETP